MSPQITKIKTVLNKINEARSKASPGPWWFDVGNGELETRYEPLFRLPVCLVVPIEERIALTKNPARPVHPDCELDFIELAGNKITHLTKALEVAVDALGGDEKTLKTIAEMLEAE